MGLLTCFLAPCASFLELSISLVRDLFPKARQAIRRSDVADRTVQSNVVVVFDELRHFLIRFLNRCRTTRTNALVFASPREPLYCEVSVCFHHLDQIKKLELRK
jgi:hypothetical protein